MSEILNLRKLMVMLTFLLFGFNAPSAKVIYVIQANGNDNNSGTETDPFKSLTKAISMMSSGDTCVIGDGLYRDIVNLPSGVTLEAIPGTKPELTGTTNLKSNWSIYKDKIYVADVSGVINNIDLVNYQVFVDGEAIVEARYPNLPGPYISGIMNCQRGVCQTGTDPSDIVSLHLLPQGDLTGAIVTVWPGINGQSGWVAFSGTIASSSGNTIRSVSPIGIGGANAPYYSPVSGDPFFVVGALCLLDTAGEYFLDTSAEKLYIYMPNGDSPQNHRIDLRDRPIVISAQNASDITIKGLNIYGSGVSFENVSNLDMEGCSIKYADHLRNASGYESASGGPQNVIVTGENIIIKKCEFGFTACSGIRLGGNNIVFTDNIVHDCDYSGSDYAGVNIAGGTENAEISYNTIYNSGRDHIVTDVGTAIKDCMIENNYFKNHATLNSDCGAFYAFGTDGGGTELKYNFVDAGAGYPYDQGQLAKLRDGLYADNYSSNFVIDHNIIIGGLSGLRTNIPDSNTTCYNNTVIGSMYGYGVFGWVTDNADMSTQSFFNNLFINLQHYDIDYDGTENGVARSYFGNLIGGQVPVPFDSLRRIKSGNNVSMTAVLDSNYQPVRVFYPVGGEPAGVGAVEKGGVMFKYGAAWTLQSSTGTGVRNFDPKLPFAFQLAQNYPNPFNPTTEIDYSVPKRALVKLTVYNILGQKVSVLLSGYQNPGNYQATFNGSRYASGVYFYGLEAGSLSMTKKMILLK